MLPDAPRVFRKIFSLCGSTYKAFSPSYFFLPCLIFEKSGSEAEHTERSSNGEVHEKEKREESKRSCVGTFLKQKK